jgi:acyl-CoA thioester hydrolase
MFERKIQVRFSECDGLGHVNNTMYFNYFEDARVDLFRIFNPSLDLKKWNLIVASTACDFLAQVEYAQTLTVCTWIPRVGKSSFEVHHAMQNESGHWVARGKATMLAYDFVSQSAMALWDEIRDELEKHKNEPDGVPTMRSEPATR